MLEDRFVCVCGKENNFFMFFFLFLYWERENINEKKSISQAKSNFNEFELLWEKISVSSMKSFWIYFGRQISGDFIQEQQQNCRKIDVSVNDPKEKKVSFFLELFIRYNRLTHYNVAYHSRYLKYHVIIPVLSSFCDKLFMH